MALAALHVLNKTAQTLRLLGKGVDGLRGLIHGLGILGHVFMDMDDGLGSALSLAEALRALAWRLSAVIVLKSSTVWITAGDDIYIYDGANPSLGVAGSGDVLSGVIATLLAAGEEPLRAAIDGVILHQKAGRKAHEDYGFYSADELILSVGKVR